MFEVKALYISTCHQCRLWGKQKIKHHFRHLIATKSQEQQNDINTHRVCVPLKSTHLHLCKRCLASTESSINISFPNVLLTDQQLLFNASPCSLFWRIKVPGSPLSFQPLSSCIVTAKPLWQVCLARFAWSLFIGYNQTFCSTQCTCQVLSVMC